MARAVVCFVVLVCCLTSQLNRAVGKTRGPNVLLIITDDQGWGDVGFHGNPHLKTPHLDRLAQDSVELEHFYVCPVCSPTRASLLTGRYNYRTGVVDTFLGRSTMAGDEITLAEMFAAAGYRTGIFGKWHLGDHYPSRAIDQGFQEALVHDGGGIGQPADPPDNSYFDPVLQHNGQSIKTEGYCSDIFTAAAMRFISEHSQAEKPFFTYLAFNCPHTPLQVPPEYHQRYQAPGLDDATARIYGMVANIDDNLGRLFAKLDELKLQNDTIVVFMTDNGPQQARYNGVLKDLKGSVHDGGIRVPCLVRWPGKFPAGFKVSQVAAHIDMAPTLLEACGIDQPKNVAFDGVSLVGLLQGKAVEWPDRVLFFQWHRGDRPEPFRACAVRGARYKLVQPTGRDDVEGFTPAWALYDMAADPSEQNDLAGQHPDLVQAMKTAYELWLADVGRTRGYPAPRIIVGTKHENPVTLTRQDWRGPRAGWSANASGYWDVDVAVAGTYDVVLHMPAQRAAATSCRLRIGERVWNAGLAKGADRKAFNSITLSPGINRIQGSYARLSAPSAGVHYIDVQWHDPANKAD
jgi:arylsulfatase A-like enzyme